MSRRLKSQSWSRRKQVVVAVATAVTLVLLVTAGPSRAETQLVTAVEGIAEFKLDNGIRVLLVPDKSRPTVTVNLTIFVGSRHEGYGEAGMAHLLEHMLFKGTAKHPSIPKELQDHGARFNGTTWVDRTNYFETLPASPENLAFALELEADRMMNSLIRAKDLASEMSVVRNEFERGENSPSRVLSQRMTAVAFEWHNYGRSTIGNRADIERVPVESLRTFYRKFYQPDNAMVIVAGQFDPRQAIPVIENTFGKIPRPKRETGQHLHRGTRPGRANASSPCDAWAKWPSSGRSTTFRPDHIPTSSPSTSSPTSSPVPPPAGSTSPWSRPSEPPVSLDPPTLSTTRAWSS